MEYSNISILNQKIVKMAEDNGIKTIKSKKIGKLIKGYDLKNAINKVKSANKSCLDITDLLNQYNSEFIKFTSQSKITNQSKITSQSKDDTSLLDSVKNDSDNNDNLSSVSSIIVLSPVGNNINENNNNSFNFNNIDMNTVLKMKSIIDKMNNSNDPRSNLLASLKPYLRDNKKQKLDEYANLLNFAKITEILNNDNKEPK